MGSEKRNLLRDINSLAVLAPESPTTEERGKSGLEMIMIAIERQGEGGDVEQNKVPLSCLSLTVGARHKKPIYDIGKRESSAALSP